MHLEEFIAYSHSETLFRTSLYTIEPPFDDDDGRSIYIYIYCISIVCWPPAHVCSVCKVASHNSNNNNNKCHARTIPSLRSISSAYRCGAGRRQRINELERPSTTKKQEKTIKTTMECYTECYVVLSLSPLGMGNLFII